MNELTKPDSPDALMLLGTYCVHCPAVLDSLSKLIKNGDIGSLKVINLEQHPEAMQAYKVRSVPWVRIGKHELSGAQTLEALKQRADWARKEIESSQQPNLAAEFDHLLSEGQAAKVIEAIKNDTSESHPTLQAILELLGNTGTVLSTRIGIGVVFEELAGNDLLKSLLAQLEKLTKIPDARIRADAYHYLGMTEDKRALPILKSGKSDKDAEVREIVTDSLAELSRHL